MRATLSFVACFILVSRVVGQEQSAENLPWQHTLVVYPYTVNKR